MLFAVVVGTCADLSQAVWPGACNECACGCTEYMDAQSLWMYRAHMGVPNLETDPLVAGRLPAVVL